MSGGQESLQDRRADSAYCIDKEWKSSGVGNLAKSPDVVTLLAAADVGGRKRAEKENMAESKAYKCSGSWTARSLASNFGLSNNENATMCSKYKSMLHSKLVSVLSYGKCHITR